MGKYTTVVTTEINRIMTQEEVLEECKALGLDSKVTAFILKEFRHTEQLIDEAGLEGNLEELRDHLVGDEGRCAYGQGWESVYAELAGVMGVSEDDLWTDDDPTGEVYYKFFQE
jgi:hypothetical protein